MGEFRPSRLKDQLLEEDTFGTLMQVVKDLTDDTKKALGFFNGGSNASIARKAKPAIFYFPVITSDAVSQEMLVGINKALERQYVTFIRLAAGISNVTPVKNQAELKKILGSLHRNIDDNYLVDHTQLEYTDSGLRLNVFLNEYTNPRRPAGYGARHPRNPGQVADDRDREYDRRRRQYDTDVERERERAHTEAKNENDRRNQQRRQEIEAAQVAAQAENDRRNQQRQTDIDNAQVAAQAENEARDARLRGRLSTKLTDNDIKKCNEMVPTVIEISFVLEGSDKAAYTIMIGVKTVAHSVPFAEMIENIESSIHEGRFLFRFLRWTTGELSFIKDYIFNFDKNRKDAIQAINKEKSRWWTVLKSRSVRSSIRKFIPGSNQLPPNATLVVSMNEIDEIKNSYDIDLLGKDKRSLLSVMKDDFLLAFVVADTSSEMIYIYFDGEDDWMRFTLSELEKENSKSDKDMKSLISFLSGRR